MHKSSLVLLAVAFIAGTTAVSTNGPRFYADDPIAREPESQDASRAQPYEITSMYEICLLYTSPSPRDRQKSRMPSSA